MGSYPHQVWPRLPGERAESLGRPARGNGRGGLSTRFRRQIKTREIRGRGFLARASECSGRSSPAPYEYAPPRCSRSTFPLALGGAGLGILDGVDPVPLVLNAHDHMDSDLAVDGLTLLDAVNGHWRWHYPGTPYMGILPMLVLPAGPGVGSGTGHIGKRWHGHLGPRGGLNVLAGGEGVTGSMWPAGPLCRSSSRHWAPSGCRDESRGATC